MTDHDDLTRQLMLWWRDDPGGTYRTWFLWKERIKNFRSIRRGLARWLRTSGWARCWRM